MSQQFSKDLAMGNSGQHGSIVPAILAGLIAAIIGAGIWMGIAMSTGYRGGFVALGVGALVGYAVRIGGNGTTAIYGIVGAIFTLLSCVSGEVLTQLQGATSAQQSLFDLLKSVDLAATISTIFNDTMQNHPVMFLIYAIGIYEGYQFSMRK